MKAKRIYALVLASAILLGTGAAPELTGMDGASMTVSAATSGTYGTMTYTMYDDYVEITGFDNSVSTLTIPSEIEGVSVTIIGDDAFKNATKLESVTIPNGVTEIGDSAFYQCSLLEMVSFPNSLLTIGDDAFAQCISLTEIDLPNKVTAIGESAFQKCVSIQEIEIPSSLVTMGSYMAKECTNLRTVYISNGLSKVGNDAFADCTSLKTVYIPLSVTAIFQGTSVGNPYYSFKNCDIQDVYYAGTPSQWVTISGYNNLASATIHYGAEDIPAPLTPDVNNDGSIDATDAAYILQFAAYVGAGGTDDIATFIENL